MASVGDIVAEVERIAPPALAESWDNTGLLLGDRDAPARRGMACLTVTPATVDEAIEENADVVIAHHPLPFRPLNAITTGTREGRLLWRLAGAGVSLCSPHTAYDSSAAGINQQLTERLGLAAGTPLVPSGADLTVGAGRVASTDGGASIETLVERLKASLPIDSVRVVGWSTEPIQRIGFACGSGGSLLDAAIDAGCGALVTGEATFHTCLAAEAAGVTLLLVGHYASERFAVETLAERLAERLPAVEFWASRRETDPIRVV